MTSIVIVTYNREFILKECLNSLFSQEDPGAFEVIVIDNHCADKTAASLKNAFNGKIKIISSGSRVSLAEAKRLGISAASGDIIAFTDDDCLVKRNWLKEINRALERNDFCGGATLPASGHFPRWWKSSLNWMIGINDSPGIKFPPLGGNAAFRRHVLSRIENGALPKELLPYGEDNFRIQKALAAGFSLGINRDMIVYHQIPAERLTLSFLFKRSWQEGRCLVSYNKRPRDIVYNLCSLPANLSRALFFFDLSRFFRMIVNLSYLVNRLRQTDNER